MSTTTEVYEAEVPQYEQDCRMLKKVLMRLVSEIEGAEAEAADTKWADEQADTLSKVLSDAQWALDNLAYELRMGHLDTLKYSE